MCRQTYVQTSCNKQSRWQQRLPKRRSHVKPGYLGHKASILAFRLATHLSLMQQIPNSEPPNSHGPTICSPVRASASLFLHAIACQPWALLPRLPTLPIHDQLWAVTPGEGPCLSCNHNPSDATLQRSLAGPGNAPAFTPTSSFYGPANNTRPFARQQQRSRD
jgi:hypothetical protein